MKKVKFTPRWGWDIRYEFLDDEEAEQLAATYTRERYDRDEVDEWIVIIPDLTSQIRWGKDPYFRSGGNSF